MDNHSKANKLPIIQTLYLVINLQHKTFIFTLIKHFLHWLTKDKSFRQQFRVGLPLLYYEGRGYRGVLPLNLCTVFYIF